MPACAMTSPTGNARQPAFLGKRTEISKDSYAISPTTISSNHIGYANQIKTMLRQPDCRISIPNVSRTRSSIDGLSAPRPPYPHNGKTAGSAVSSLRCKYAIGFLSMGTVNQHISIFNNLRTCSNRHSCVHSFHESNFCVLRSPRKW